MDWRLELPSARVAQAMGDWASWPWRCTLSSRGVAASPSSRRMPQLLHSSGMCIRISVFGRYVGRSFDHPRLREPSEGGRNGPFALVCFQQQAVSGKRSDAAGVCSFHSPSAARLARRIVLISRSATSTVVAGWAANKPFGVGLLFFFPGVRAGGSLLSRPATSAFVAGWEANTASGVGLLFSSRGVRAGKSLSGVVPAVPLVLSVCHFMIPTRTWETRNGHSRTRPGPGAKGPG